MIFEFANGATGLWDCNRYNESNAEDPRFVFGQFLIEGSGGSIRLYDDSRLTIQRLGEPEQVHDYARRRINFGGDCVYFTLKHFVNCLVNGKEFETNVEDYLTNIRIQEACYRSNEENRPMNLKS